MDINLKDLIAIIPDFINLFLPGFIFVVTSDWADSKKTDTTMMAIWSFIISILVKSACSTLHSFLLSDILFSESSKIIIFSSVGFIFALIISKIKQSMLFSSVLRGISNKTINENIFNDLLDKKRITTVAIYPKEVNTHYVGRLSLIEEKGLDSWLSLIYYCLIDNDTKETIFDSIKSGLNIAVVINLRDVDKIEIIYNDDSKVWKKLTKT